MTLQVERRIADLIGCLKADDSRVRYRARGIVHVIAETNLAGAIAKVDDKDLEKIYTLHLFAQNKTADGRTVAAGVSEAQRARYKKDAKELAHLEDMLTQIIKKRLAGVGG